MSWVEPLSAAIVSAWLALALRREARRKGRPEAFVAAVLALAAAAWISEESCIRLYGFYGYADTWRLSVGRVPLLVVLIWPVVVLSAHGLARALLAPGSRAVPLLGAAIVLADAALIEPVCVRAGLWSWTRPGLFDVPPIGVLGWAFFALLAIGALERGRLLLLLVPPGVHALLLAAWWGALRWVEAPLPPGPAVAAALALALLAGAAAWRAGARVPRTLLLTRVPAALLFLALLCAERAEPALWAWALASTPVWLLLTARASAAAGDPG